MRALDLAKTESRSEKENYIKATRIGGENARRTGNEVLKRKKINDMPLCSEVPNNQIRTSRICRFGP